MSAILTMFFAFFKIGLFSFGGGYAIIPFLQAEAVGRGWLTAPQFLDIVAISQVTPGPIAVNMATFVGYRLHGIPGSLIATLGVCLPSLILVTAASYFIAKVNNSKLLKGAFYGLRPAACGLIAASAVRISFEEFFGGADFTHVLGITRNDISVVSILLFAVAFFFIFKLKTSPFLVIIGAAAAGVGLGYAGVLT